MKHIDLFLLKDFCKAFKKCRVGFLTENIDSYNKVLATTRMHCYDMILFFEKNGISAELYKPYKKYEVVFFVKNQNEKSIKYARKLKKQGTRLIMDTYSEVIDLDREDNRERINILELCKYMERVNVFSKVQYKKFSKYHENVHLIGDNVHDDFFMVNKEHKITEAPVLVYCGYNQKVKDVLNIKEVIKRLQMEMKCKLLIISNCDPEIDELKYDYIKYNQSLIAQQYCLGDIMIAPRPMQGIEELSHSNTKVAYPMAVGLPVVASPVPSYEDSPAILCYNNEDWYKALKKLIENVELRKTLGKKGRKYIKENYSLSYLGKQYIEMVKDEDE